MRRVAAVASVLLAVCATAVDTAAEPPQRAAEVVGVDDGALLGAGIWSKIPQTIEPLLKGTVIIVKSDLGSSSPGVYCPARRQCVFGHDGAMWQLFASTRLPSSGLTLSNGTRLSVHTAVAADIIEVRGAYLTVQPAIGTQQNFLVFLGSVRKGVNFLVENWDDSSVWSTSMVAPCPSFSRCIFTHDGISFQLFAQQPMFRAQADASRRQLQQAAVLNLIDFPRCRWLVSETMSSSGKRTFHKTTTAIIVFDRVQGEEAPYRTFIDPAPSSPSTPAFSLEGLGTVICTYDLYLRKRLEDFYKVQLARDHGAERLQALAEEGGFAGR